MRSIPPVFSEAVGTQGIAVDCSSFLLLSVVLLKNCL